MLQSAVLFSDSAVRGGRTQTPSARVDLYGGFGQMTSLSGSVKETRNGSLISGGLNTDLGELGIGDSSESVLFGGKITGKWFTLLVDVRQNKVEASGTADSEIRLNVDGFSVGGSDVDYLLIPVGSEYTLDAESNWIGVGLRFTPFTIHPGSRLRFTPWIHVGAQLVDTSFSIDSGNTVRLEVPGFGERVFAVRGQAEGEGELVIPEIGLGGEIRFLFQDDGTPGVELIASGTFKILEYDGTLDDLGISDDEFDGLNIDYTSLDAGVELLFPLGERLSFKAGVFLELVDARVELDSKPEAGDFQREIDGEYTLWGLRAGITF